MRVQNLRDFPQIKLDSEINAPFLLNEHGDPPIFFQVFTKNSLIKNIFEEEKSLIVEHYFLLEKSPTGFILGKARTSSLPRNCPKKCNIPATKQSKTP